MDENILEPMKMITMNLSDWKPEWGIYRKICIVFINNQNVYKFKDNTIMSRRLNKQQILSNTITVPENDLIHMDELSSLINQKNKYSFSDSNS